MNNLTKPRIIFFGTDDISATVLNTLIKMKTNVVGVITRSDKVSGRKHQFVYSDVKKVAIVNNLKLLQPTNLKQSINEILALKPELILTCSYGKIIPEEIINYPIYHAVNIHPSLLPKYRGASPIQYTIWNNDNKGGVTFLYMTKELDEGDIIFQQEFPINDDWTSYDLRIKIKEVVKQMLINNLNKLFTYDHIGIKQDPTQVSFTSLIKRENEFVHWNNASKYIYGQIKALYDKPIACTIYNNLIIKIHKASLTQIDCSNNQPGQILEISQSGILVATNDKAIYLKTIQFPGKKPSDVSQLINGKLPFVLNTFFK